MSISFKSIGHGLATFLKDVAKGATKVEGVAVKVEATKTVVEGTTSAILGAVAPGEVIPANAIENAAYAALGELVSVIQTGGAAASAKLADAGLDKNVVSAVQTLASGTAQVGSLLSAAVKSA